MIAAGGTPVLCAQHSGSARCDLQHGWNRGSGLTVGPVMTTEPFRGSAAVAAGLITPGTLRGPRFRRIYPDVYVPADMPVDLAVRSRAAYLLSAARGVLAGYSAAEVLGAQCAPLAAPAELIVSSGKIRPAPGLLVHRWALDDEAQLVGDLPVTTPLRTAYDLARRSMLVEAVVAVDALAGHCGFPPAELLRLRNRHCGARGSRQVHRVVQLANPRAESPMETRLRLALVLNGLPEPEVQWPVLDERGRVVARLDLAYPRERLGVEYDGLDHRTQHRAMRDLDRQAELTALGWRILRFMATHVLGRPAIVAERVRYVLAPW